MGWFSGITIVSRLSAADRIKKCDFYQEKFKVEIAQQLIRITVKLIYKNKIEGDFSVVNDQSHTKWMDIIDYGKDDFAVDQSLIP